MNLRAQPNEMRCSSTEVVNRLPLPPCCPVTGNPLAGSEIAVSYTPGEHLIEVQSLHDFIASYRGGRGEVRSMEGMIQDIAQASADCVDREVSVVADLVIAPDQKMLVKCAAVPTKRKRGAVYLCGGINGLSDGDCRDWREVAKGIIPETLDPMRRDYRGTEDLNVAAIVRGDLDDIFSCAVLLVNATRPSWGTAMEIVYAHMQKKPIVAFVGASAVSPWLRFHCSKIFESIEDACSAAAKCAQLNSIKGEVLEGSDEAPGLLAVDRRTAL